jgi:hypothetical protein
MNQLMSESCVRPWDLNSVYKDKFERFVSQSEPTGSDDKSSLSDKIHHIALSDNVQ